MRVDLGFRWWLNPLHFLTLYLTLILSSLCLITRLLTRLWHLLRLPSTLLTSTHHTTIKVLSLPFHIGTGTSLWLASSLALVLFRLTLDAETGLVALKKVNHVILEVTLGGLDHHSEVVLV